MVSVTQNYYPFSLIILLLLIQDIFYSQTLNFGHISVEDGLSNRYVNCLLQDRTGFVWFGTDDGLNRYDGYDIKIYRNDPEDSATISNSIIWSLFEDKEGYIWVGTKGGKLNRYDPHTDNFKHWILDSSNTKDINITVIYEDSKNYLWIGTYKNGLY